MECIFFKPDIDNAQDKNITLNPTKKSEIILFYLYSPQFTNKRALMRYYVAILMDVDK